MALEQRGKNAVRARSTFVDPRWGGLDPEEYTGKVKLMEHPAYGQRYFRNEDVENRESRGWVVVEYSDPTIPTAAPAAAGIQVGAVPSERTELQEAAKPQGDDPADDEGAGEIPVVTRPRGRKRK